MSIAIVLLVFNLLLIPVNLSEKLYFNVLMNLIGAIAILIYLARIN